LIIFKKSISRLRFIFFEAFFWLLLLTRTMLNDQYQKKSLPIVLGQKKLGRKTQL